MSVRLALRWEGGVGREDKRGGWVPESDYTWLSDGQRKESEEMGELGNI